MLYLAVGCDSLGSLLEIRELLFSCVRTRFCYSNRSPQICTSSFACTHLGRFRTWNMLRMQCAPVSFLPHFASCLPPSSPRNMPIVSLPCSAHPRLLSYTGLPLLPDLNHCHHLRQFVLVASVLLMAEQCIYVEFCKWSFCALETPFFSVFFYCTFL